MPTPITDANPNHRCQPQSQTRRPQSQICRPPSQICYHLFTNARNDIRLAAILRRSMPERSGVVTMAGATLLISSKNYSSWSLRGFLLARLAGLTFEEKVVDPDDPINRAELLVESSSIRIPALMHDDVMLWDTLAIAEYLNETFPAAAMLPSDRIARARCRSISG